MTSRNSVTRVVLNFERFKWRKCRILLIRETTAFRPWPHIFLFRDSVLSSGCKHFIFTMGRVLWGFPGRSLHRRKKIQALGDCSMLKTIYCISIITVRHCKSVRLVQSQQKLSPFSESSVSVFWSFMYVQRTGVLRTKWILIVWISCEHFIVTINALRILVCKKTIECQAEKWVVSISSTWTP
jgi:hypothetical protein